MSMAYNWDISRVRDTMQPFIDLAERVKGNTGTYCARGGLIFHGYRVNSYCRIKVPGLNVTFDCYIKRRDDVPEFMILRYIHESTPPRSVPMQEIPGGSLDKRYNPSRLGQYNENQLRQALADWAALARVANM